MQSATDINYRTLKPSHSDSKFEGAPRANIAQDVVEPQVPARKWLTWSKVDLAVSGMLTAANAAIATQYARRAYNCLCDRQVNTALAGVYLGVAGIWTATTVLKSACIVRQQGAVTQP